MMTWLHGERVVLRPWTDADLAPFAALNADPRVMQHFPQPLTRAESDALAARIRERMAAAARGHGLWALQVPGIEFAGFVGLASPAPDVAAALRAGAPDLLPDPLEIGWRLATAAWGQGYATEAARLVLRYAHDDLGRRQIVSFTGVSNRASEAVMRRIGMTLKGEFDHPALPEGHRLRRHRLYVHEAATL